MWLGLGQPPVMFGRLVSSAASLLAALLLLGACANSPAPVSPPSAPEQPPRLPVPTPPATIVESAQPDPYAAPVGLAPAPLFPSVPEWTAVDPRAGLSALKRSCEALLARPEPGALVSTRAAWAGTIDEWQQACTGLVVAPDAESARAVLEARFVPVEVVDPAGNGKFTGYFEPVIDARDRPSGRFTDAIPGPPGDLLVSGERRLQRLPNGRTRPYPARANIRPNPATILGYADPADLFFLQIQGSGRLVFEDGRIIRAAYHAHNGRDFVSTANWLVQNGEIPKGQASMQGIRSWMASASPARLRQAINANPRYVFFEAQPIDRPNEGPAGALGVPLTALGAMAVDPEFHALGVPYVVETTAPGLGGLWRGVLVAQDTGGAIKGPVRGDIYFGTGAEAGDRAGTMNAPGRMWALLPPVVAERLRPGA
ncbi:MAG: MltA domain-containing protein [Pseudomonadota bacterium]